MTWPLRRLVGCAAALLAFAACSRDWAFLDDRGAAAVDAGGAETGSIDDATGPDSSSCTGSCPLGPPGPSDASTADASSDGDARATDAASDIDASTLDGGCNPLGKFDDPFLLPGINTDVDEESAVLSGNELTIYFARGTHGGAFDIYSATRGATNEAFGNVQMVAGASTDGEDIAAMPTADGLAMFVDSYVSGARHIMLAAPAAADGGFGAAVLVPSLASDNEDGMPFVLGGGDVIYFSSSRLTQRFDIYRAARGDAGDYSWDSVPGVNDESAFEGYPVVTSDERGIYFGASVPVSYATDIYAARREKPGDPFAARALVQELDAPAYHNYPSWLSADGCRLYITSSRAGGHGKATGSSDDTKDIWLAVRHP